MAKLLNLEELVKLASKNFTKPRGMREKDFEQKIRAEFKDGQIKIKIKETVFTRKLI